MSDKVLISRDGTKIQSASPLRREIRCDLNDCGCRYASFIWASNSRKLVYLETPKTACSSIKKALGIRYSDRILARAIARREIEKRPLKFSYGVSDFFLFRRLKQLIREEKKNIINGIFEVPCPDNASETDFHYVDLSLAEALETYKDYRIFAVYRDPCSRMISNYRMFCRSGIEFREQQVQRLFGRDPASIDFTTFLNLSRTHPNHHWDIFSKYIPNDRNIEVVEFERLADWWKNNSKQLGLNEALPHENASKPMEIKISGEQQGRILNYFEGENYINDLIESS